MHMVLAMKKYRLYLTFIKSYGQQDTHDKEDRFVFIGRLGKQKQVDHLIKSYNQFLKYGHQTKLAIYGADEQNQNKSY